MCCGCHAHACNAMKYNGDSKRVRMCTITDEDIHALCGLGRGVNLSWQPSLGNNVAMISTLSLSAV